MPSDSLCLALAASAMWRQKFLLPRTWRLVLKKARSMMRLSGLTLEPSTANRGVESWMESLAASRARITPSQESEPESPASTASSGMTSAEPLARFYPHGCFWRTSRASLFHTAQQGGDGIVSDSNGRGMCFLPDSGLFLETWPRSGSMRNGVVYPQPRLVLRTSGKDGSAWPTARAEDSECCGNHPNAQDSLGGAAKGWNTPSTEDFKIDGPVCLARYGTDDMMDCDQRLRNQAATWHTPHGMTGVDASGKQGGGGEFAKQATQWPTPDASMSSGGRQSAEPMAIVRPSGTKKAITLNDAAQSEMWTTPQAHDSGGASRKELGVKEPSTGAPTSPTT